MSKVAAIILAAGGSARFGRPKQLIEFQGKTLLRRVVDAAEDANCSPVIVVTGSDEVAAGRELQSTPAIVVQNDHWQLGIASSIRAGVRDLINRALDVDAVVLLVCDQPFTDGSTIRGLIELREKTHKVIVASSYDNTLGVPALFDRSCFKDLLALDGDHGAKSIILPNHQRVAKFPFPDGKIDIDTVEDWKRLSGSETKDGRLP